MRKSGRSCCSFFRHIKKIKLVDRCLLLFMLILMMQSTYNLFVNELNSAETHMIDIIVRTTSAGIFGYLLSPNFFKKKIVVIETEETVTTTTKSKESAAPTELPITSLESKKIGFATGSVSEGKLEINTAHVISKPKEDTVQGQQQVIIATVIGVFALVVLLFVRNCAIMTPAMASTTAQMRDFVSGCVGFLLGSPGIDSE